VIEGILLIDLDGTLYTGDEPIRCYAAELAALTGNPALVPGVEEYLAGTSPVVAADGWEAVRAIAGAVPRRLADAAFLRSRYGMADGTVPVTVSEPLVRLVTELRDRYLPVLATNSPRDGLLALLDRLGVANLFAEVVFGARKPDGLIPLATRLLHSIGAAAQPHRLLSIGDHWRNDIAPALRLGAIGGYVDRFGRRAGPAQLSGRVVDDLLPGVRSWAADPAGFAATHQVG
jgi:FMN phosphatase YigB (HAD superfamily)